MEKFIPKYTQEYIASFPPHVQELLNDVREAIKKAAPDATEKISWGMPSFSFHGPVAYFAAHTKHIGFYPIPPTVEEFKEELSKYKQGKGSVQFPYDKPMPLDLIARMVKYRADENIKKALLGKTAKEIKKRNN